MYDAPQTAARMTAAAAALVAGMDAQQRNVMQRDFDVDGTRREWSYLPEPVRPGLPLSAMDDAQRKLAHELIVASTSMPGYAKVVSVMAYIRSGPKGIVGSVLSRGQMDYLMVVIAGFAGRLPDDVGASAPRKVKTAGDASISFAWAGGVSPGELLPDPGPRAAHRARQHPVRRKARPLGVARPAQRLRRRHPRQALPR